MDKKREKEDKKIYKKSAYVLATIFFHRK